MSNTFDTAVIVISALIDVTNTKAPPSLSLNFFYEISRPAQSSSKFQIKFLLFTICRRFSWVDNFLLKFDLLRIIWIAS